MSNRLERLIELARRTGDRLIIHDPSAQRDLVIMDLDQYELLVTCADEIQSQIDEDLEEAHSVELESSENFDHQESVTSSFVDSEERDWEAAEKQIDEINREIAFLREQLSKQNTLNQESVLEEELKEEIYHEEIRKADEFVPVIEELSVKNEELLIEKEEIVPQNNPIQNTEKTQPDWHLASELLAEKFNRLKNGEIPVEPFAPLPRRIEEPQRVPVPPYGGVFQGEYEESEDEPIFLEEPV